MNLPIILRIFKGEHLVEVKQFQLDQIVIGNQAEVNLNLQDSAVSPIHALIEKRGEGTYYLCDLGSAQGTFKGSKQVLDQVLESGEEFSVGPFRLQFNIGAPRPVVAPPEPKTAIVPPPQGAPVSPALVAPPVAPTAPVAPTEIEVQTTQEQKNSAPVTRPPSLENGEVLTATTSQPSGSKAIQAPKHRIQGTFAPPSAVPEENQVIKASKGSVLEISVGWKERIIETYHFRSSKAITVGSGEKIDIPLPSGVFTGRHVIVDFQAGVASINLRSEMSGDLILERHTRDFEYLKQKGRISSGASGSDVLRLEQGEAFRVALVPGLINIYIRYVPTTQKPALVPFLPFTMGEIASVLFATALVGLWSLYIAIHAPIEEEKKEVEPQIISVTKFVYPTVKPPPEPPHMKPPPEPPKPPPVKIETPPKEKQKVVLGETTQAATKSSSENDKPKTAGTASGGNAGSRAAEVAPNKNMNAKKSFTSVQQGGAVKLGAQAGANASQTQKPVDLSTVGLTSTFGGGGARNKLAQAVQGAGGIIGDANQATGSSGFSKNRPGDDLGSAFKDTGAGGKGVATEGISGGITNGRGSGNAGYGGVGTGSLGNKGGVQVDVGGFGTSFVGTIDRAGVLRVIRSKQSIIRRCYEKQLFFKKDLGGRVVVKFEIGDQGKVLSASIDSSTMNDSGVENCLKNELVTWRFPDPPPNSTAEVLFPFNFQNKE